jgi:hypothetical protein
VGKPQKDMTNYRLLPPGEERLMAWMAKHLVYAFAGPTRSASN